MARLKINIINTEETKTDAEAKAAAIDVKLRSISAKRDNKAFASADHVQRVDAVKAIAKSFFTVRENIFDQARPNKGRPFTAVKVYRTQWPKVSPEEADKRFYKPLEDLGNVELRVTRDLSSQIIRVYL